MSSAQAPSSTHIRRHDVAQGLAHLPHVFIQDEAVGDDGLVGSLARAGHRGQQGGLEPAPATHTHTRTHACTRARTHVHEHTRTHMHTRTHTLTHACTRARTHAHAHTRTRTHTRARTSTHKHATHTHTQTHAHTRTHTRTHTQARTHTNTHTHTHTHTHEKSEHPTWSANQLVPTTTLSASRHFQAPCVLCGHAASKHNDGCSTYQHPPPSLKQHLQHSQCLHPPVLIGALQHQVCWGKGGPGPGALGRRGPTLPSHLLPSGPR